MRVGIFGGVFNPPHLGHVRCARAALDQLDLDRVVLVPVHDPPHREIAADPGPRVRERLAELAVMHDGRLDVSGIEAERDGPSYTVETLRVLREREPDDELTLILGADQALTLARWREPEDVLRLARVAVASRHGIGAEAVRAALAGLAGSERVVGFEMERTDVSSTRVRAQVAAGMPVRDLVPAEVADEIEATGLYRDGAEAARA